MDWLPHAELGIAGAALSTEDLAWAAGLFEGEGCISVSNRHPQASLTSTDFDVVMRFQEVVGDGALYAMGRKESHHKDKFTWKVTGERVRPALTPLLPWLGARRRSRFHEVLDAYDARPRPRRKNRKCDYCDASHAARGMCYAHYARWKRNGDPLVPHPRFLPKSCSVDGCEAPYCARGFCSRHYHQFCQKPGRHERGQVA